MELNPENICKNLRPDKIVSLREDDSLNILFEKQKLFQEKLGRLALARKSNMKEKCDMVKDDIFNMIGELHELMANLPHKKWKKYDSKSLEDWICEEQRIETLFEYIDAFHFFINIGLILGFMPDEVFHFYLAKNKENHKRQDNGY